MKYKNKMGFIKVNKIVYNILGIVGIILGLIGIGLIIYKMFMG